MIEMHLSALNRSTICHYDYLAIFMLLRDILFDRLYSRLPSVL